MSVTRHTPASFSTYLAEINRTPLLTAVDEKELAARVLTGDAESRDRMVRANLRLVVRIARGYTGKGLPIEDLVSEGNMGLLRAVEGFDAAMNTRFSTYAAYWIKQSIKRGIVNAVKTIRVPAYLSRLLAQWWQTTADLTNELGRQPMREEVVGRLGLSKGHQKAIADVISVSNVRQTEHGGGGLGISGTQIEAGARTPLATAGEADDLKRLRYVLGKMDRREATILQLRFGLGGDEPKTLREIGEQVGLTRERVRQIESEALAKLGHGVQEG